MGESVKHDQAGGQQLIPGTQPATAPPIVYDPFNGGKREIASFPTDTEEGFARLMNMKHGESRPLADQINTVLRLRNFFVTPCESTDEKTGEVTPYPRIVLEDADGVLYSCGSHGVFSSLHDLVKFRKVTPWEPAVQVKVIAKSLPGGRRYFVLLYCPTVQTEEKGSGKAKKA